LKNLSLLFSMGRKRRSRGREVSTIEGQAFVSVAMTNATSVCSIRVNPVTFGSQRLVNMALSFSLFRFTMIRVEVPPNNTEANSGLPGNSLAVAYTSVLEVTAPGSINDISELDACSTIMTCSGGNSGALSALTVGSTYPIALTLGRRKLLNKEIPWYQCNASGTGSASTTAVLVNQGTIYFGTDGTAANGNAYVNALIRYVCEFTDAGGSNGAPRPILSIPDKSLSKTEDCAWEHEEMDGDDDRGPAEKPDRTPQLPGYLSRLSKTALVDELLRRERSALAPVTRLYAKSAAEGKPWVAVDM